MKDTIVYPYSNYFTPFLRQMVYDKKYNIISSVVPGKWCLNGIDASFLDEGIEIGIPISTDFDAQLQYCSVVIWAEYDYTDNLIFFNYVLSKMKLAIKLKKNIICCQKLSYKVLCEFKKLAEENNIKFEYIFKYNKGIPNKSNKNITIPVITVMGIGENCSKFETQLFLRRLFLDAGFRVSQIGSRKCCELLGFHSFPDFMFERKYNEIEKITAFNNFVYEIQQNEKTDILILGIPGGIMPYDEKHDNHYGITCFEVFSALRTDFNILNIWNNQINNEYIRELQNTIQYKFCAPLDCIGISNVNLVIRNKEKNDMEYYIIDNDHINKQLKEKLTIKTYNILNEDEQKLILEQIIEKLS